MHIFTSSAQPNFCSSELSSHLEFGKIRWFLWKKNSNKEQAALPPVVRRYQKESSTCTVGGANWRWCVPDRVSRWACERRNGRKVPPLLLAKSVAILQCETWVWAFSQNTSHTCHWPEGRTQNRLWESQHEHWEGICRHLKGSLKWPPAITLWNLGQICQDKNFSRFGKRWFLTLYIKCYIWI